jgi:multidrug transporter EmrE-like cation transporter
MNRFVWWATLVTSALSVVAADVFMKKAAISWSIRSYGLGWLFYVISIPGWYFYLKGTRFATCGVLFSIFTDSLILLLGVIYFRETVSVRQWVGFGLGMVAVLLLSAES